MSYDHLVPYATVRQLEYLDAIKDHGSIRKAAKSLGVAKSAIDNALDRLRRSAAIRGVAPEHDMTHAAPDPYIVKGVSTYYGEDGKPKGQWVKTSLDAQRAAEIRKAALDALTEEIPRLPPVPSPGNTEAQLCNVYTLTDCHVGMLAWGKETGADWDLRIAEKTLTDCFSGMVISAPKAETCIIAQLGDFLHSDGLQPVTPTHGHVLDQDGRFAKVVQAAVRILRRLVSVALEHHKRVIVLMAEGNHDLASSVWLRAMFAALYEQEPRVSVIDSELPYYVHRHGSTMLAWHHGHLKQMDGLPLLFAASFPEMWGATRKRYAHVGHRHHHAEKEHAGMTVIQHSTLAARDSYAARGGWISERQATAMTFHAVHGLVARNTVTPEMMEPA